MTIVLPYPTPQGSNLADNDAGNGVPAPPLGAPEFMATDTYNDVDRYDKTSIRQNTDNILAINAANGTMAEQDASAVAITGGTIDAAVSVAEAVNATQFGGLTLQQLYDLTYPVNEAIVIRNIEAPPPTWPGTTSTWALTAEGLFLKPITTGQTVGETFAGVTETDPGGGHDHGGVTGDTALTTGQMPAHTHNTTAVRSGGAGTSGGGGIAGSASTAASTSAGSGAVHDHPIASVADHVHTFDDNPPFQRVAAYLRTA